MKNKKIAYHGTGTGIIGASILLAVLILSGCQLFKPDPRYVLKAVGLEWKTLSGTKPGSSGDSGLVGAVVGGYMFGATGSVIGMAADSNGPTPSQKTTAIYVSLTLQDQNSRQMWRCVEGGENSGKDRAMAIMFVKEGDLFMGQLDGGVPWVYGIPGAEVRVQCQVVR